MKNKRVDSIDKCTGCCACGDKCPMGAISFEMKKDGFYYPIINENKCINCGLCLSVCPRLNKNGVYPKSGYVCYSLNKEVYMNSSSGGVFSELAIKVLNDGGIVYGAAFDGLIVKHIRIDSINELYKLQKSKYIQSDTKGIFYKCLEDLKNKHIVLFSGVPCQISALNNYLGKKFDSLITCDLICHGVPSQKRFNEFIEIESKNKHGNIVAFNFREKFKENSSTQTFSYQIYRNKKIKTIKGNYYDFPYLMGFQKYLFLRESCYSCNYANMERCSDITLGDYWDLSYKLNKPKGLSMVIINSKKGDVLFNKISDNIYKKEVSLSDIRQANECLNHSTIPNSNIDNFEKLYKKNKELAIKKYLIPKKKKLLRIYYSLPFFIKKIIKKFLVKDSLKKMW